ncbi:MAG: hypothetical protein ACI4U1_04025 [Anaerovoracaceae bacterium]
MRTSKKCRFCICVLVCLLLVSLMPATVFAEGTGTYVAWIGETGYETLEAAVTAAASGDTITLGEGKYTLYKKGAETAGKDLTFVGQGTDKTEWGIGATMPDPDKFGTEYNGDYSFDGSGTITFKNMTLQSSTADYLGFIRADNTVVEDCVINGKTFYWGYTSATFKNTTFNAPEGDYAIWTYCSPTMTFDDCTFNVSGKAINVYRESGAFDVTVNYKDCSVISSKDGKAVMNINDSLMGESKFFINISGRNTVTGVTPDDQNKEYSKKQKDITCSRLFEFNTKYGPGNSGRTIVSIDGNTVWENGLMVDHKNSDGCKDNAFTVTYGEWIKQDDGTAKRSVTKVCDYCGYTEISDETGYAVTYTDGVDDKVIFDDQCYTELIAGSHTPDFNGTPTREGYIFKGWTPTVSETVTANIVYTAVWEKKAVPKTGDNSNLFLWIVLLAVSCGLVGTTVCSVKGAKNK